MTSCSCNERVARWLLQCLTRVVPQPTAARRPRPPARRSKKCILRLSRWKTLTSSPKDWPRPSTRRLWARGARFRRKAPPTAASSTDRRSVWFCSTISLPDGSKVKHLIATGAKVNNFSCNAGGMNAVIVMWHHVCDDGHNKMNQSSPAAAQLASTAFLARLSNCQAPT